MAGIFKVSTVRRNSYDIVPDTCAYIGLANGARFAWYVSLPMISSGTHTAMLYINGELLMDFSEVTVRICKVSDTDMDVELLVGDYLIAHLLMLQSVYFQG